MSIKINKKTKRKASGSKTKKKSQVKLPDRKLMEQYISTLDIANEEDSLIQAQELICQAWETEKSSRRIELAYEALSVSSLCADAYVLLADEEEGSTENMLDLYAMGVEAGEITLGEEAFEADRGMFWQLIETRPYMRAREGLAHMLLMTGKREEAASHFYEMLELNPNDNQGIRYMLVTCLLELDDRKRLRQLLDTYEDDSDCSWSYSETLLSFRETGPSAESLKILQRSWDNNCHVRDFLTGAKPVPKVLPEYASPGCEDEAIHYAMGNIIAWDQTPGAIDWLLQETEKLKVL